MAVDENLNVVSIRTRQLDDEPSTLPRLVARHQIMLSGQVDADVPPGAELTEWLDARGVRRFLPTSEGGVGCEKSFVLHLSVMGEAILEHWDEAIDKPGFSISALRLFYQQGERIQERFGRNFKRVQDLTIQRSVRAIVGSDSVIPDFHAHEGKAWGVTELLDRGQQESAHRNIVPKGDADLISLGLHGAARDFPFNTAELSEQECVKIIRLGVFDLGATERPDAKTIARVLERLAEAMEPHVEKDATAEFDTWFFRNVDNIVKQVSQKKSDGGKIDRKDVRRVILELVFEGYRYTAKCFSVAMREVLSEMDVVLTDFEQKHFETMFLGSSEFGRFPLLLLRDRLQALSIDPFVVDVDSLNPGVILRLLTCYAEMNRTRRHADREIKQAKLARNKEGKAARNFELNEVADRAVSEITDDLPRQLSASSRERQSLVCECMADAGWDDSIAESNGEFVFIHACRKCGNVVETTLSEDEIQQFH